ncbi:MAG: DUF4097 family beta strand repeat protein [Ruminiclostridium sp.]|nr:DUF4097 family beta strand repeat protein [Ruminiclostridium sp.]
MSKTGKWLLIFGLIALASAVAFGISVAALGVTDNDYGISIGGYDIPVTNGMTINIGGANMGNAEINFIDNGNKTTESYEKNREYNASFNGASLSDIKIQLSSCHANIVPSADSTVRVNYKTGNAPVNFTAEIKDDILTISEKMNISLFNFGSNQHSDLTLELPESLYDSFDIDLASGKITSSALKADDFNANVASGTVELGIFAEKIDLNVASGKMVLNNCSADKADSIKISAASGNIEMNGFGSDDTKVELASGHVVLNGISGKVKGELASGKLTLGYSEWNDDLEIKLMSGNCDVTLPAGSGADASLKRLSGSMSLDLDGQNAKLNGNSSLTVGGSNVHRINGDIASGNISVHN